MRKALTSILLPVLFCCFAVAAQDDFPSWIRDGDSTIPTIQADKCCRLLWRSALTDRTVLSVTADNRRYALLSSTSEEQYVKVLDFDGGEPLIVYSNRGAKPNHFSPLSLQWAPDGDRLFVKYGYSDVGNGYWFPHDASSGTMIGDQEFYQRILATSIADRTDPLGRDGPLPVWTLGGKQYENEITARRAGYEALFSPVPLRRTEQSVTHVDWKDGKKYRLFLDPDGGHFLAYIIVDRDLIDTVRVDTPMYQRILFLYKEDNLKAKILPQTGRQAVTVDFGAKKLEWITDLRSVGLLVQSADEGFRYWQVLDTRNPAACAARVTAGTTPSGSEP